MKILLVTIALLCAACAGPREVLIPGSTTVPAGVDLSGEWRLSTREQPVRSTDSAVDVFIESGQALKITQTEWGLFIAFDRSIVEEYRFGEQREISVGPITADRASGWKGDGYVIETLDQKGAKLVETYRLQSGGAELERTILVLGNRGRNLSLEQRFRRE